MPRINYIPSARTVRIAGYVAAVVALLLVLALIAGLVTMNQRLEDSEARQDALAGAAEENAAAAKALSQQVERLGAEPSVDVDDLPPVPAKGDPGEQGPAGETGRAPTAAEIQTAVTSFCADGRCDGEDPTGAQVAAAVASYCDARGDCRGRAGRDGQDGTDGEDGADGAPGADGTDGVDGRDAPPPTAAQIEAAVAAYCTANGCQGPPGAPGAPGADGRGVVSVTCEGIPKMTLTFTYTDGTTETVACDPSV